MASPISDRRFGVEIECGNARHSYATIRSVLPRSVQKAIESLGYDGSGIEVRTTILKGNSGFAQLKTLMDALLAAGCYVTNIDGMHVHHDAPEFVNNPENIGRLVDSWANNRDNFLPFVHKRRHTSLSCANTWKGRDGKTNIKAVKAGRYVGIRGDINTDSLEDHGTIEIRLHEGTLNYREAEAWIRLCQAWIDSVVLYKRPHRVYKSPEHLLRRFAPAEVRKPLREKMGARA